MPMKFVMLKLDGGEPLPVTLVRKSVRGVV